MSYIIESWIETIQEKLSIQELFEKLSMSHPNLTSVTFTRECPVGCTHCWYPKADHSDIKLNDLKKIDQIIEATRKTGVEDLIHVGRILKAEHLPILKKYQEKGMILNLIENGMGVQLIPEIKKSKIFFDGGIDVSIDGDQITHDLQRKTGSYSQSVLAAKAFQEVASQISITGTASALNYSSIVGGLTELQKELPFVSIFQITTTSPVLHHNQRIELLPKEMQTLFCQFEEMASTKSKMRMLIYRLEDIAAILPQLVKYGHPTTKYISIIWHVGKSTIEFFPQSIVTAEEFAIDSNGRHILPFGIGWHLNNRPEEWEMRDDIMLTDPDKSYENLVQKYQITMGEKILQQEKEVFQHFLF